MACHPQSGRMWRIDLNLYQYGAQVDVHVFVDQEFVLGIECKAYAENAMLKRIMVDFSMLKSLYPRLGCCLVQLESQLGGDYSKPLVRRHMGSPSSHTLMSVLSRSGPQHRHVARG